MKVIDSQIEKNLTENGYVRVNDNEAGARFVKGSDSVYISGHMVFVRSRGHLRAFFEDKARMLGIRMMEIQAHKILRPFDGKEDTTNYDIRKLNLPI